MVSHLKAVSTLKASGSLVFGGTLFTQHLYVVKYHFKWMLHLGMSRSIGSALIGYRSASDHNRSYRIGRSAIFPIRYLFRSDIFSDPIYLCSDVKSAELGFQTTLKNRIVKMKKIIFLPLRSIPHNVIQVR